jgi:hypothetical protein
MDQSHTNYYRAQHEYPLNLDPADIAEEVDSLIVTQNPSSSQLQEYSYNLFDSNLSATTIIGHYMESLGEILLRAEIPNDMIPNHNRLRYNVMSASELIIIVNYDAMDKRIDSLLDQVNESSKTLIKYATLNPEYRKSPSGLLYYAFFAEDDTYKQ